MTERTEHAVGSLAGTSVRARATTVAGLLAFSPMWGAAMLFSVAGDRTMLVLQRGTLMFALSWAAVITAVLVILRRRYAPLLYLLAGLMVVRYVFQLPVASNNKTITVFMNVAILACAAQAALVGMRGENLRDVVYDRIRVVARALLAVMYFYGIFHKVNTDFLDPTVSCAVALYKPLASGFGLADNVVGQWLSIWATFIVEAITIVALYWKRYFAIGLICGLMFHYVIPISVYSWYMDFSSLVLALYILSIPREVSAAFYERCARIFRTSRQRFGSFGALLPFIVIGCIALVIVTLLALRARHVGMLSQLYHSVWVLLWAVYGGIAMVLLTWVAMDYLPWRGHVGARQPLWVYSFPLVLFLTCLSPYVGLKTESSIAMFSNLHTEGGTTNHLLFAKPPYLFGYQGDLAEIIDSSNSSLRHIAANHDSMVWLSLHQFLRRNPDQWVTYRRNGVLHQKETAATLAHMPRPNLIERRFLIFKPVDFDKPKVCTH